MRVILNMGRFLLQFFPLTVFLKVAFLNGTPQTAEWLNAFIWGGSAAIIQLTLSSLFSQGYPLNRIILGVNVYLILGGMSVFTNQIELLEILNNLKESGIFLCVLIVGVFTTIASKAGFVGAFEISMRRDIRRYSMWLIVIAFFAVTASFWFRGQMIISAAMPLIVLSVATRLFKRRLQRGQDESTLMHDGG